jgi:hypothetical protein
MAARGAGTAAGDAGGRVSAQHDVRRLGSPRGGVSPGPQDCAIEYRWAENQQALVADLPRQRPWQRGVWRKAGSSFDEGQCPSHGTRRGHQYNRGREHQTQQTE